MDNIEYTKNKSEINSLICIRGVGLFSRVVRSVLRSSSMVQMMDLYGNVDQRCLIPYFLQSLCLFILFFIYFISFIHNGIYTY